MTTFRQLANRTLEVFNPHLNVTELVKKHKTCRNARKYLRKLGVTKSEQNNLMAMAKKQDPKWPTYK